MKKKLLIAGLTAFAVLLLACAGIFFAKKTEYNQKGILLAFDDYSAETWREAFDLFEKYDVHVTFFINASEPTDFCTEAAARGHEIGFHTVNHAKLTDVSREEFYAQAIAPIAVFREAGCELTSFAYPYGEYEDWMNEALLKHYQSVRGAWHYQGYYKEQVENGFIESKSIDNISFESTEDYRIQIGEMLDGLNACDNGTVASMFSHAIGAGDWCISLERLEILFQEAQKRGLKFYTFKELQ